jgi:hypothetical protein
VDAVFLQLERNAVKLGACGRAARSRNRTQVTLTPSASRSPAPNQLERHETPDPVRSDAVDVRFHRVRQRTDRHHQRKLTEISVLVVLM